MPTDPAGAGRPQCDFDLGPGSLVGQFTLLYPLGEGGMGEVWAAEQGEPLRRQVALKLLKPGLDTRDFLARFEVERQALAVMDHPNIARLYAADATPVGRPYYAMEFVRGVPITSYCDNNRLTTRQRLTLFVAVCRAVQHAQLASMAMGLNEAYVVQSSSANLYRLRDRILRGLGSRGPALFSVFSGASGVSSGMSLYLVSAAAMESRAFPAFTYDPSAGPNWASRFSLDANTQVDLDWPVQDFTFEDEHHQRVSEEVAFTVVDFVASDRRHARHLARVPRANWNAGMVPVDQFLSRDRQGGSDTVPTLLMVDDDNVMHKTIVDERLVREARRCRELWHSLQELGGVHNSHAEILLAREGKVWEERSRRDAASLSAALPETAAVPAMEAAAPADVLSPTASAQITPERSHDEAHIETARCSTCNECTTINGKMFAYHDNRQAYVADVTAGTYAQLVEAAGSCQVSIIHPGRPRNSDEPGLERLLERAAAFA